MKHLDSLFDSEELRRRAAESMAEMTQEEIKNWLDHPCTRALRLTLNGDYIDYHQNWENGGFTKETSEGTAQLNSKALGAIEAIKLISEYMENLPYDQG